LYLIGLLLAGRRGVEGKERKGKRTGGKEERKGREGLKEGSVKM